MKKMIGLFGMVLMICACVGFIQQTAQIGHSALRSEVTADDTALDGTTEGRTFNLADKPATAAIIHEAWNNVQILFYGTDAADETCNFKLYCYRENGPAILVGYGSFTLGTAVTGTANEYYADTISVTDVWPTDVIVTDSGNNRIATLAFDALGHKYIYCEIDIPASGQVSSAGAKIGGF